MSASDNIEPPIEWKPARDIPGWALAVGLFALLLVFELLRGFPSFASVNGAVQLLARDIAMLAAPVMLGWAIVAIPEAIARRRGRPRTAIRRNTLIAAWVLGGLMMVGMFAEKPDSIATSQVVEPPIAHSATAPPAAAAGAPFVAREDLPQSVPAPTAAPPPSVTTGVATAEEKPTPWTDIVREPEYVQATVAERKAIRDLYWRICIEDLIPGDQRGPAYSSFLRDWEIMESDVPVAPSRTMSVWQYRQEQQHGTPSPVSAGTMNLWCGLR